jgi:peptidyl-lysine (3S)-dioxygenase / protease
MDMDAALDQLSEDVADLWSSKSGSVSGSRLGSVPRIAASELTALRFVREFVSTNRPVVICGLVDHWTTPLQKWNEDDYICDVMKSNGDPDISVNVTPTGWGDCVQRVGGEDMFVQPEERRMKLYDFLSIMKDDAFDGVAYISHQNDSLRTQFSGLMKDVDDVLHLACEAFDSMPDATNLWIGDEKAVSSLHKDHYENMYVVVQGEKHFLLFPPADVAFLENGFDDQSFRTARFVHVNSSSSSSSNTYCHKNNDDEQSDDTTATADYNRAIPIENSSSWRVLVEEDDGITTPWIRPFDTSSPPPRASPIEVVVRKGEVLYLPALWYHQVSQRGRTIAVNYWHDMTFDHKWVYHNFVRNVVKALQRRTGTESTEKSTEGVRS